MAVTDGRNDERQGHHGAQQAIALAVGIEQQGDQHAEQSCKTSAMLV